MVMYCKEEGSSQVSLQLLRGGIWTCIRYIVYVGVCDGDYVSQPPYVWYFYLSGHCELLFLPCFIAFHRFCLCMTEIMI